MYSEEEMNRVCLCLGIKEGGTDYISRESVYNQYYTDLITKLDKQIEVEGTTIHCFYTKKMGKKYLKRYQKYFKKPDIVVHDLAHEQLLMSYPLKWVEEVKRVTKVGDYYRRRTGENQNEIISVHRKSGNKSGHGFKPAAY